MTRYSSVQRPKYHSQIFVTYNNKVTLHNNIDNINYTIVHDATQFYLYIIMGVNSNFLERHQNLTTSIT
jgi:hypothetical protein